MIERHVRDLFPGWKHRLDSVVNAISYLLLERAIPHAVSDKLRPVKEPSTVTENPPSFKPQDDLSRKPRPFRKILYPSSRKTHIPKPRPIKSHSRGWSAFSREFHSSGIICHLLIFMERTAFLACMGVFGIFPTAIPADPSSSPDAPGREIDPRKKLLITIPPKPDNLAGFDLSANETSLFAQFLNSAYYTAI